MYSLCFAAPGLLLSLYLAGRGSFLPHWTAIFWLALLPIAAMGWSSEPRQGISVRRLDKRAVVFFLQALLSLLLMFALLSGGWVGKQAPAESYSRDAANPVADLYGWDDAAKRATQLAEQQGLSQLVVVNWSLASRVVWYARPWPVKVSQFNPEKPDQFALWFGQLQPGEDALWLQWSQHRKPPPLADAQQAGFQQCQYLDRQAVVHWGRQLAQFEFYACRNWQHEKR